MLNHYWNSLRISSYLSLSLFDQYFSNLMVVFRIILMRKESVDVPPLLAKTSYFCRSFKAILLQMRVFGKSANFVFEQWITREFWLGFQEFFRLGFGQGYQGPV